MIERVERRISAGHGGNYFTKPKRDVSFIRSGCKTLDLTLGGGWAMRRIANIVGDKSTAKTLLCIEASANFILQYPKGKVRYRECESAFSQDYAEALGMPINRVDFGGDTLETVEDLFEDLEKVIAGAKHPELYILDSLDALSDSAELDRGFGQASYGGGKAKDMSKMFRLLVRKLAESNVTLIIVSQVRDKIGVKFGRKTTRSGGRALDFYASQVLYLAHIGPVVREVEKIKRPTGIRIKAKCDKNKVGLPLRECEFNVMFGYGTDDVLACLTWLKENYGLSLLGETDIKTYAKNIKRLPDNEYAVELKRLHDVVEQRWYAIESRFLPTKKKYNL